MGQDQNSECAIAAQVLAAPRFEFIAKSFRISYRRIESISEAESITFSDNRFPIIYDVMIKPDQTIHPMLVFGGDLTNLDKSVLKPVYS